MILTGAGALDARNLREMTEKRTNRRAGVYSRRIPCEISKPQAVLLSKTRELSHVFARSTTQTPHRGVCCAQDDTLTAIGAQTVGRGFTPAENKDLWLLQHGGSKPPPYKIQHLRPTKENTPTVGSASLRSSRKGLLFRRLRRHLPSQGKANNTRRFSTDGMFVIILEKDIISVY